MVRLKGPLLSLSASKQLGKTLIFKTKNGKGFLTKYSKPSSIRKTDPSSLQEEKRVIYGEAVEAWGLLSNIQKSVYNQNAQGKQYSGFNLFLKEYFADYPLIDTLAYYGTRTYGIFIYANQE